MTDEEAAEIAQGGVTELRAAFDLFDIGGDGRLDAHELHRALTRLGQPVSLPEVRRMIASVDHDRDGHVSFVEFQALIEPPPLLDPEEELRDAFAVLDTDGDGYLSAGELRHAAARAGDLDDGEFADLIAMAEQLDAPHGPDGASGGLSFDAFRRLLAQG